MNIINLFIDNDLMISNYNQGAIIMIKEQYETEVKADQVKDLWDDRWKYWNIKKNKKRKVDWKDLYFTLLRQDDKQTLDSQSSTWAIRDAEIIGKNDPCKNYLTND